MAIYDISLPFNTRLAGWPGDSPYRLTWTCRIDGGASVNLGEIATSLHTGTHVDAPYHFDDSGQTLERLDLEIYIGPAAVVDVAGGHRIGVAEIIAGLAGLDLSRTPRLLLKTGGWPDHERFPEEIPVMDEDVPSWLGQMGVRLIGLDVPSVDHLSSKDLPIHHALRRNGIAILESLDLTAVRPGVYELIALPLRLEGADGSPVRAILRDEN